MDVLEAIQFSFNSMTGITVLVILFLTFKSVQSLIEAYKNNNSYKEMKENGDNLALSKFYYGTILAISCVVVFFLPYLLR
jgi:hypothetical protein